MKEKSLLIDNSVQREFQEIARHLASEVTISTFESSDTVSFNLNNSSFFYKSKIENLEKYEDYLRKLHDEEALKLNKNYVRNERFYVV